MSQHDTDERDAPEPVDVERIPHTVAGRGTRQRAERIEYTRPSVVRAVAVAAAVSSPQSSWWRSRPSCGGWSSPR